ncbi:restriction endonuclease subunit S [Pantoea sp. MHSD4]|uniref:restriction endonuclease subunit S n=1 Tax=Pantoea sp. MHSD4 TaxID=2898077 RepID=UPI000CF3A1B9|nr:restriction endonuclease subunit S [Pantoea sp. MHSD4]MCD2355413.1 restriction endonuclease subunit S [Pantoea sp. MHSD4]PQL29648.1 hypothetical protein C5L22_03055 [Pantoea ananatis]
MSQWDTVQFEQLLVDNKISYGVVQPGAFQTNAGTPLIRVNNIKNGKIDVSGIVRIHDDIAKKHSKTRLNGGELLITVVGAVGECAIVPKDLSGYNVARAVSVAKIKDIFDKRFIAYQFKTEDIKFQIYGNTNDTVQPTLNLSELKKLIFRLPKLSEQKAIASVLSALDDKIDLLHRQNRTLESMAETLFRQWFIEEAQDEWIYEDLGSVIDTSSGGTPSRKEMSFYQNGIYNWVKSKELNGSLLTKTEEMITDEAIKKSSAKLLPAYSTLIAMYGATVGEYALTTKEMACNQAVCALKNNKKYPYTFIFMYIKSKKNELINQAIGSAQQNISQIIIKKMPIPTCHDLIAEYHTQVEAYFDSIKLNIEKIQTLENLRDILLPKLMSGEVQVRYAEEAISSVA